MLQERTAEIAWVSWLRQTKWDWFVTLSYGDSIVALSREGTQRHVQQWLDELRVNAPKVYAALAIEQGPAQGNWHCHLLLGGLGTYSSFVRLMQDRWRRYGPSYIVRYDPTLDPPARGACAYLMKTYPRGEITLVGKLQKYRPRKKKTPKP